VLTAIESEYEKPVEEMKTNDKLTEKPKNLIEKREKLKQKSKKSNGEKVELSEQVKREIKKDIKTITTK
jgi:hypothetical protein